MNIVRPTLLLNETICRANIRRLAEKARRSGVVFRPHFKTHQSHDVGRWFREEGVTRCTVSSVRMASYFAADGWKDITVAFPLNPLETESINELAASIRLNLCVVNTASLTRLLTALKHPVNCLIEIDTGYRRTGVDPQDKATLDGILGVVASSELLRLEGFLTHAGESYTCRSGPEILKIHKQSTELMKKVGQRYRGQYPDLVLSIGDTPTCSIASDFSDITEIRPGNFVFYDIMQRVIGSCAYEHIAVAMACPVVAVYPSRQEVVVHGGGVHFSKDFLKHNDAQVIFGQVVQLTDGGWKLPPTGMVVKSLSQEHGVIQATPLEMEKISVGDVLGVLPVHSCMTADVMGEYYTLSGQRIAMMPKS
ncbi:MAG: alanine racemase [Cytophagales bacterium]|nr:alanine racemase [Cytophagales bacterium]